MHKTNEDTITVLALILVSTVFLYVQVSLWTLQSSIWTSEHWVSNALILCLAFWLLQAYRIHRGDLTASDLTIKGVK